MARKILLADDSVTAQNMGRKILTDAGYEVITVNNGSAALKKIAEQLPELIVLDVYMPGYSGLEVCQRLKETRETARIPVLLTVGKLEPFKTEDARRARADAFIVKPFEASELLTALTKLEDKIVPQPAGKSGQFAKVWADLEQGDSGKAEKFGDAETGWKNRLIIPTPGSKQEEPEPEEVDTKSAKGSKKKDKKDKDAKVAEAKVEMSVSPVGVPADITPEEVAAIAAAAAKFEEKSQAPGEFSVKPAEEEKNVVSSTSEKIEAKPVEVESEKVTPVTEAPAAVVETAKPAEVVAEVKAPESAPIAKESTPEVAVAEVKAAEPIPTPAASTIESASSITAEKPVEKSEVAPPAPKWVAQEISIPPAELGINLEQEMQKATTVLQAATAPMDLSSIVTEAATPAPVESAAVATPEAEKKTEELVTTAPDPETERPQEPAAVVPPEPQPEVVAAVAAAASAGTSTTEANKPDASVVPALASEPAASAPEVKVNESELAAAWAQWKQIRETVVGSQLTSQIADAAAAELKNAEAAPTANSEEQSSEKPSNNPTAIASIVDSVLAELKPKLVEEIARKLGDEKDKKKK